MPRFEPFVALRYAPDAGELQELIAPPYDVLSDAEVEALASSHPRNIVHLDVPRPAWGPHRYERAGALLAEWVRDGVLVVDQAPSFTIYRMEFTDAAGRHRQTVGVIGALEVVDEGAGGVLPHERTTPKAASDRLDLLRATRTNLSPVWGLSLAAGLSAALTDPGEPFGEVTVDGVIHTVERVTDPDRLAEIAALVGSQPVLIADGHHRYAVSRTFRDEVRAATGRFDTAAELTMAYVAELVDDQLSVEAIHRVYRGISAQRLAEVLSRCFDLEPAGHIGSEIAAAMVEREALILVHPNGHGTWLRPRADAFRGVRDLDGARLEAALEGVEHEVAYQHGVAEVMARVTRGDASAAVLLKPVSVAEIRRTADEGALMPPKSTFFTPKLRTGLVLRPLTGLD